MSQIQAIGDYLLLRQSHAFYVLEFAIKQAQTLPEADAITKIVIKMEQIVKSMIDDMQVLASLESPDTPKNGVSEQSVIDKIQVYMETKKRKSNPVQPISGDQQLEPQTKSSVQNINSGCEKDADCKNSNRSEKTETVKSKSKSLLKKITKIFVSDQKGCRILRC